jgi:hypothetical protein
MGTRENYHSPDPGLVTPSSDNRQIFVRTQPRPVGGTLRNANSFHFQEKSKFPQKSSIHVAYFLTPKNMRPKHHVCHAKHHNFTIEKPRSKPRFFQNTPQNSNKNSKAPVRTGAPLFFCETTS